MRIGFVPSTSRSASVRAVMGASWQALRAGHDVRLLPASASWPPQHAQLRVAEEFVEGCDVLFGMLHPSVLEARKRSGRRLPYVVLMLGTMPRGAFGMRPYVPQLARSDILVVSSEADRAICEAYFPDSPIVVVPLSVDTESFRPLTNDERMAIREELGFDAGARIELYTGRITPEKNLHTVLRVFRMVLDNVPSAHLVLAGAIVPTAFREFGVTPAHFALTLGRAADLLGLPPDRVLYAGAVPHGELRRYYGAADVAINLTLHHDENFGLAQAEALACGVPVVGTAWGGLKETILEDVTGHRVGTTVTPRGVKVNWWEAANRVIDLLLDRESARRLGTTGAERVASEFSPDRLRDRLADVIVSCTRQTSAASPDSPITVSPFAHDVWTHCDPANDPRPSFRRDQHAFDLYRRLIQPYAGDTVLSVPVDAPLEDDQVLVLASPITRDIEGGIRLDDPLYPFRLSVPPALGGGVAALIELFRGQPAMTVKLARLAAMGDPGVLDDAVRWALDQGLLLRSVNLVGWADRVAPRSAMIPLFRYQDLTSNDVDFFVAG